MMRHIVLARRVAGSPQIWGRADFMPDGRWITADLKQETGNRAVSVQTNLRALVDGIFGDLSGADITVTPRLLNDVIARGNPASLDVPPLASVQLLCPMGRVNAEHQNDNWCSMLVVPARGVFQVLDDRIFVFRRLAVELKSILTDGDIRERNTAHDLRELWVRHNLRASELAPDQVKPYFSKPADLAGEQDRQAMLTTKARRGRVKAASSASAEAGKFNKKAGEKFAEQQAKRRAKTS